MGPILDVVDPTVTSGAVWYSEIVEWVRERRPDLLREFYQRMQDRRSADLFRFPAPDDRHTPAFLLRRGESPQESHRRLRGPGRRCSFNHALATPRFPRALPA